MMTRFGFMEIFMFLPFLLFLLVIGLGIYFLVKLVQNSNSNRGTYYSDSYYKKNSALDILDERYAKGEISEEEYKQMKKNLNEQQ